jgi:hypothetical protein
MTSIKQNVLTMRVRRFPSTLEMALFNDNIPAEVYHNLLDTFGAIVLSGNDTSTCAAGRWAWKRCILTISGPR